MKEDGLLRTYFLAITAVDASQHVDLKLFRSFLDVSDFLVVLRNGTGSYTDGLGGTHELAQLAGNALLATIRILDQCGNTPITARDDGTSVRILQGHLLAKKVGQGCLQAAGYLREITTLRQRERLSLQNYGLGHGLQLV